jgi:CHAT domain-containing protein
MHRSVKLLSVTTVALLYSACFPKSLLGTTLNEATSNVQGEAEQLFNPQSRALPVLEGTAGNQRPKIQNPKFAESLKHSQFLGALSNLGQDLEGSKSLDIFHAKSTDTGADNIQNLRELVNIYTSLTDSEKTIELSESILPLAQKLGERDSELKLLLALGDAYNSTGKYEQAVESANASLKLAGELDNPQAKAVAFLALARASQSLASPLSDYRQATMAAISGLTTAWEIEDYDIQAKALALLGSVYNSRRENRQAVIFAQQGLKVAQENNVPTAAASSLLTLAGVHLQEGKYQKVIQSTEEGRDVLQKLQKQEEESAATVMQSLANLGQGNVQQSLKLAEQGLATARDIKSARIEALALLVLSMGYSQKGDFQNALELNNQSREIAKELRNRDLEALILEVRGEIYRRAGQTRQIASATAFRSAIASYQEAVSISNSFSALAGLSRLYQESNLSTTAIAYYKQAVNKNEEQNPRIIAGLPVWLQESFPQAVQNVNGLGPTNVYRSFTNLLLSQTRKSEAQQMIELLKGQELREYTGNPRINNTEQGQPASLTITPNEQQVLQEYGSLISFGNRLDECQRTRCSELEQLLQQREGLTQQYYQTLEQLEAEIKNKRATDEAFVDPNQFAQKAQKLVEAQPGTLLIYPIVLEDKIWLMWASKGGIFTSVEVSGVSQSELEDTVSKFRQLLQNRLSNIDELQATGKQLYDWLLKPLEKELQANQIQNLVFALDRSTRYIPISALFDGEKYLVEKYAVSTVISANLTETASPTQESRTASTPSGSKTAAGSGRNSQVLAMGVSEAVGGFPPLPNVPEEINAIVRQEGVETPGVYPGQEFLNRDFNFFTLRDNVTNHQLLHIATHSKFVPGGANQSFLVLGTGEKLAVPEIETWLNLRNTNLVVLSACETALGGTGLDGREIAGVGYYFLKAGAKTVVASLWKVDDYSTRLLMEQFYENLAKGTSTSPVRRAEALRQAQLALLTGKAISDESQNKTLSDTGHSSAFRHPYYWAPFILMGSTL